MEVKDEGPWISHPYEPREKTHTVLAVFRWHGPTSHANLLVGITPFRKRDDQWYAHKNDTYLLHEAQAPNSMAQVIEHARSKPSYETKRWFVNLYPDEVEAIRQRGVRE